MRRAGPHRGLFLPIFLAFCRSEEEWANDIANTPLAIDKGDGSMPPDTAAAFATFVASVKDGWSLSTGVRDRVWSPGPVRSSRFL
jgi:hypothetical protein